MAIPLKYNLRSVLLRRTGTAMAVLSVAATVAVFISVLALSRGLEAAFTSTGHPLNLVVIRMGSQVETNSSVARDQRTGLVAGRGAVRAWVARAQKRAALQPAVRAILIF